MSNPLTRRIGLIAATAVLSAAGLIAPSAPAQAATPPTPLGTVTVSGLPAEIPIALAGSTLPVTVRFAGQPADPNDADKDGYSVSYRATTDSYASADVTVVDSRVADPFKPRIESPASAAVAPDTDVQYALTIANYVSPGTYRLTIPVTQVIYDAKANKTTSTQIATVDFRVVAPADVVLSNMSGSMGGKLSKKARWTGYLSGPDYLAGSVATYYYKAKGKKKFVKVVSVKLNATGDAPSIKTKKGAIRKLGQTYWSFSAVPYVAAFNTPVGNLKKV